MAPNLFDYANNERSQDGMICWLIAWAGESKSELESEEDKKLRRCGRRFVEALLNHKRGHERPIKLKGECTVKILQQEQNIDILARINERHVILIEDKIDRMDGDGQLEGYYGDVVEGHTQFGNVDPGDLYPVYLKTGNQPLLDDRRIEEIENYKVFNRRDFLDVLEGCDGCNSTLRDFRKHLQEWEDETNSYRHWTQDAMRNPFWRAWEGFFRRLEREIDNNERWIGRRPQWEYVNAMAGQFPVFWWNLPDINEQYLQIEARPSQEARLCFKVNASETPEDQRAARRERWTQRVMLVDSSRVVGPNYPGVGNTMTFAWWQEWMAFGHDDKLDVSRTVENLKRAAKVLTEAIRRADGE